tara:strand:+ start:426 stop:1160 length:735 start_codon:yes stop_codon:yes gene_type:complete
MEKIISFQNLQKKFKDNLVLSGINLNVNQGESLAIIGPSGCGKSVLIKCMLGILQPNSGQIYIDNIDFHKSTRFQRETILKRFGVTFQGSALFDSLTIWQNVSFKLSQSNSLSKMKIKEKVSQTLSLLDLDDSIMYKFPSQISGGMQKRVAIARAIIDQPEFLIFDEPTAGLDPITGSSISELILDNVKRLGSTTITITHDISSMNIIADKVVMLNGGKIEWAGKKTNFNRSNNYFVKKFLGKN